MSMIHINDLRFGNWVYATDGSVRQINEEAMEYLLNYPDNNQLSTIGLTEEWLKKFGFERSEVEDRDGDKFVWWIKEGISIYDETEYNGGYLYVTYIKGDGSFKSGFQIKTVHRLQNLYQSLTGAELKS